MFGRWNSYLLYHCQLNTKVQVLFIELCVLQLCISLMQTIHDAFKGRRNIISRSQWPRGLRQEQSSLARTLGSWVRIPLEAWLSVCVYSVCR
jgi:hypothetical protein